MSKIIEPVASRCVKFRFSPISEESQINRLEYICSEENIRYDSSALSALVDITDGDLRRSIMMLQFAGKSQDIELTGDYIYEVSGLVPNQYIQECWEKISDSRCTEEDAQDIALEIICEGFDIMQFLSQILDVIINQDVSLVSDLQKAKIAEVCGSTEAKLIRGGSEKLNITNLFMNIHKVLK